MQTYHTKLFDTALVAVPPPPARFTWTEWNLNNVYRNRICADQQQLADRVLEECDRVRDEIEEKTLENRRETDHQIKSKIQDIEFNAKEIDKQRKEVCLEVDNLTAYMERLKDALNALGQSAEKICRKCILFREGRLGIDLCFDSVEKELKKELQVIEGSQSLLTRVLQQANEQVRRLRSTLYFMDRDLEDKMNVLKIDGHNLSLKETSLNLSMYHGFTPLNAANITLDEWDAFTKTNIDNAAKEINSTRHLRFYVDTLLKQVIDDLWDQFHIVNEAFRSRIEEMKNVKTTLEVQHAEIVRQANEITRTITTLQKAIADKEGFMALAHTRLGNRAHRPGMELCRDLVETNLVQEVREIQANVNNLQLIMTEAQASLRYLLKTQIQLEEDINVKTNTIKIDEVDCMTLRQSMDYHAF